MARDHPSRPSSPADLTALAALFQEHRPKLLAMLGRRLDPALAARSDPEDILSEAFLVARRKWDRFQAQQAMTPYAWLYRIALDCLIETWRRQKRGPRDVRREMPWPERSSVELALGLVSPTTSPSDAAARADLQRRMRATVALLKEKDREILWMRHSDQLSFKEAAGVLGISESAATLRYVRALERLKQLWQQQEGVPG